MTYTKLLLIDDDEEDLEIFLSALKKIDGQIACFTESNARLALQKLITRQIATDIIFVDLNMPVMTGQEFLLEIKKEDHLTDIPVVIFSTSAHAPTIRLTKELGAKDFITKPDKYSDLVKILQTFLK